MPDTEKPEPTQPSTPTPTPTETPEAKAKELTAAEQAAIKRAGLQFAAYVLGQARKAPDVTGALLAARQAVKAADADMRILASALGATMPPEWRDDETAIWLGGMTRGEAEYALATFASFWVLGFDKGRASK